MAKAFAGKASPNPWSPAGRASVMAAPSDLSARALRFSTAILVMSLLLQRFGVPFGEKALNIVGPLGLAWVAHGLATGALSFHRGRLITYMVLMFMVMFSMTWHATESVSFSGGGTNINSLGQFLLLTFFATLTFAEPVEEGVFFKRVTFWFAVIAVAGILQFLAQFVGLGLFAFTDVLPASILYEQGYNLQIMVGVGEIMKSNGFLLIEPSVFSQVMALALIIEAMGHRRIVYLLLFVTGLLLSFSGTGWIVLAAFVIWSVIGAGSRGALIAMGVVLLLGSAMVLAALFAPDFLDAAAGRMSEISTPGTSGHQRFITPFWVLADAEKINPFVALVGLGSGATDRLLLPYEFAMNTPVKVTVDYGVPVLVAYVLLFVLGRKSPVQAALVVPAVVLFLFTGGYQQYAPMLFIVLLLNSVARLEVRLPTPTMGVPPAGRFGRRAGPPDAWRTNRP